YYLANFATYGATGALTTGSAIMSASIGAAVTAAGMLAVNALVPVKPPSLPSASSEADSSTYSVAGARNTMNPFGTVPVLLGRHRITPPQGAKPFTEIVGSDQYVRQLFILGYSDLALVSEIRIGDTPLSYYREVQWEFIPQTAPDAYPKYYSSDVNEEALSVQLKESEGWNYRTTAQECDRFSIDISFPRGLVEFEDDGDKKNRTVSVDALYRKQGTSTWLNITGNTYIPAEEFKVPSASRRAFVEELGSYSYVSTVKSYILCCSPAGDVELREGVSVPYGYLGIYSFQINGTTLQNVVSIAPPGSTGFSLTQTGTGFSYVKITMGEGTLPMGDLVTTGKQTTALRRSFTVTPGARGFYEVAVRRLTADSTKDSIVDEVWWSTLRAVTFVAPIQFPQPLAALSLRIKATGQLNGIIDELNVDAVTVCKDWDYASGQWAVRPTENPASLFRYVLQHPANSRRVPDAQLDLARLQAWHNFCRVNGFSYSRYHDFADGVYSVLQDIASAGRAAVSRPDGLWGIVVDDTRTTIAQHFTPENSSGFGAEKALPKLPHGWRVRFINEQAGYQSDERIVYADGYHEGNATEFEALELPGVTDPSQVWKLARYHYAVAKLRPEEYEFFADMEHIVCTRGDLIRMAHDVPLWGVAQGRVKAVVGQFVTVDNACNMISPIRYVARFRLQTGASLLREVVCVDGTNQTIELMGAGAVPEVGDLFMFGELGVESSDLLVKHIEPAANFSARIVAVDYSPAIFTADSGAVPAFQTKITKPYASRLKMPPVPVITLLRSDEAMLIRNADGS
ncbi:MAG: phage tail protein, partial [Armatimonadia bacterium]